MNGRNIGWFLAGAMTVVSASCGGGGDSSPDEASAPAPTPCAAPVVQMFGDSTQDGQRDNLQRYMDQRFGPGRVVVENHGVAGSVAREMPIANVKAGAVTASNFGINDDSQKIPVEAFKATLRANATTFFQTPNPPHDAYAPAVREVAAELNRRLIDVSAWTRAQPNWELFVPDGVHPDRWLYEQITNQLVGPAIGDFIAPRVCPRGGA